MNYRKLAIASLVAASLAGCAADDPHRRAKTGAAVGAVLGAVAGHQVDGDKGRYVGAAVGAIAGAAVGNYMDKQKAQLERDLASERARNELQITELSDGSLKIGVASDVSFDIDSAQLRPNAMTTYAKIAEVLRSYDKTVIHVVGHTDTSGSDSHNQSLSERRAAAVASYLGSQGVPGGRLRQEGRGEREPLVRTGDNVKEARNRRVDVVIKPVVEGQEQQAWTPPPYLGG